MGNKRYNAATTWAVSGPPMFERYPEMRDHYPFLAYHDVTGEANATPPEGFTTVWQWTSTEEVYNQVVADGIYPILWVEDA